MRTFQLKRTESGCNSQQRAFPPDNERHGPEVIQPRYTSSNVWAMKILCWLQCPSSRCFKLLKQHISFRCKGIILMTMIIFPVEKGSKSSIFHLSKAEMRVCGQPRVLCCDEIEANTLEFYDPCVCYTPSVVYRFRTV